MLKVKNLSTGVITTVYNVKTIEVDDVQIIVAEPQCPNPQGRFFRNYPCMVDGGEFTTLESKGQEVACKVLKIADGYELCEKGKRGRYFCKHFLFTKTKKSGGRNMIKVKNLSTGVITTVYNVKTVEMNDLQIIVAEPQCPNPQGRFFRNYPCMVDGNEFVTLESKGQEVACKVLSIADGYELCEKGKRGRYFCKHFYSLKTKKIRRQNYAKSTEHFNGYRNESV